jgi:hypothetical protein
MTPELIAGSSPNFYHRYKDTWHNTRVFDLTYFSRRSKFKTCYKVGLFCYYWFDMAQIDCHVDPYFSVYSKNVFNVKVCCPPDQNLSNNPA